MKLFIRGSANDLISGSAGSDLILAGGGDDIAFGNAGDDTIYGMGGNDKLYGGSGNDKLYGGTGMDELRGGSGNDQLNGGSGLDKFIFGANSGVDVIKDFQNGVDKIYLTGIAGFDSLSDVFANQVENGTQLQIDLGGGNYILIDNYAHDQISYDDFVFG
jgi:Ca2+-binding RTX toxin-like protein